MTDRHSRTVYSTASGRVCPKCGWPRRDCKCSSQFARDHSVPAKIVANQAFLKDLASELKRACGAGGAVVENGVEIQGDLRDRIRVALEKKGWTVRG